MVIARVDCLNVMFSLFVCFHALVRADSFASGTPRASPGALNPSHWSRTREWRRPRRARGSRWVLRTPFSATTRRTGTTRSSTSQTLSWQRFHLPTRGASPTRGRVRKDGRSLRWYTPGVGLAHLARASLGRHSVVVTPSDG